jgi:HEAT repeat protein
MPVDWLALWGVTQAAGFLFKPVLEELAKDAVKDIFKDKIKASFGSVFKAASRDTLTKAYGRAVKELLQLIQDELIANDIAEAQVEAWNDDVKLFIGGDGVQQTLRRAFSESASLVDAGLLARSWQQMPNGPHPLPGELNWPRIAKLFSAKVRNIRYEEKELRDILAAQASAETAEAVKNRTGVAPDFNLEKYREALLESHQHLKLEVIDHTGSSYKVQLRSVFVPQNVRDCQEYIPQVFEIPKEHLLRLRKSGGMDEEMLELAEGMQEELVDMRRRSYLDQSPRSVMEVVADERLPHVVILGSPGSGKSTLLKAMALEWAQEIEATARAARPVPLFIELREYDRWECPSGKSFVRFLHEAPLPCRLNQLRLDEILRRRGGAVLLLDGLDEIFDQNRRGDALNAIHSFSNDYHDTPVIVTSRIIGYQQRRLSDAGFRHFMLQDLDDDQIEEFLDRWHQTFLPEARERGAKRRRLGEDNFAFVHRTLLEYFCASALVRQSLREESSLEFLKTQVFAPHWRDESWHEVLRLIAGMDDQLPVEHIAKIIDFLLEEKDASYEFHNIFLAANCCLEVRNPRSLGQSRIRVTDALLRLVRFDFPYFYDVDDEETQRRDEIRDKAVRALANPQLIDQAHSWIKERSQSDKDWVVRLVAVYELVRGWKDDPDTLPLLKDRAVKDDDGDVRYVAVHELVRGWKHDPDTLPLLKDRAVKDDDGDVRYAAVQELARGWKDDPGTLPLLKDRAAKDGSGEVRRAAVQELARGWKDDPGTLPLLKDHAAKDDDYLLRLAAVYELGRGWKDDPDTLPLLKDRAAKDGSWFVRRAAVRELARGWKDDPDTLPWLKDRAVNDPLPVADARNHPRISSVRDAAIGAIFRGWPDDPGTLSFLREREENDPTPWLREEAKRWADEIEARG